MAAKGGSEGARSCPWAHLVFKEQEKGQCHGP